MSKVVRARMVKEMTARLKKVQAGVFVDYRGLSGKQADALRKELKVASIEVDVLKNSLAKLTFKEMGLQGLEKTLIGQLALIHGPDPADCAKKVLAWKEKNKKLEIKGGLLEKQVLSPDEVKKLSTMPNRLTLLTQIACVMAGPARGFAVVMNGLQTKMALLLKALEEKQAKEGAAKPAEAAKA